MIDKNLVEALTLATKYHNGQKYGIHPYMYHLRKVAASVDQTSDLVVIALLHDIWEDTDCSVEEVAALFPDNILQAISDLTKMQGETHSEYIAKVKTNPVALHVKIHDTLCNLTESVKTQQWWRVRKYSKQLSNLCSGDAHE